MLPFPFKISFRFAKESFVVLLLLIIFFVSVTSAFHALIVTSTNSRWLLVVTVSTSAAPYFLSLQDEVLLSLSTCKTSMRRQHTCIRPVQPCFGLHVQRLSKFGLR